MLTLWFMIWISYRFILARQLLSRLRHHLPVLHYAYILLLRWKSVIIWFLNHHEIIVAFWKTSGTFYFLTRFIPASQVMPKTAASPACPPLRLHFIIVKEQFVYFLFNQHEIVDTFWKTVGTFHFITRFITANQVMPKVAASPACLPLRYFNDNIQYQWLIP